MDTKLRGALQENHIMNENIWLELLIMKQTYTRHATKSQTMELTLSGIPQRFDYSMIE
jgi:hypothetical protein